jgi:hypothetical protein
MSQRVPRVRAGGLEAIHRRLRRIAQASDGLERFAGRTDRPDHVRRPDQSVHAVDGRGDRADGGIDVRVLDLRHELRHNLRRPLERGRHGWDFQNLGPMRVDEDDRRVREEFEAEVQDARDDTLELELGAEAQRDHLVDPRAVQLDRPATQFRELLQVDVEPHWDPELLRLDPGGLHQPGLDLGHGTDLDAVELDRRSEVETVHRSAEVRDKRRRVTEQPARSQTTTAAAAAASAAAPTTNAPIMTGFARRPRLMPAPRPRHPGGRA